MNDSTPTPRHKRRRVSARISGDGLAGRLRRQIGRNLADARRETASESGISMIEVLVSALLVGLIVLGTFSGFDAAGRASAEERAHAQATVLAQQDQERLRGLTAAKLSAFGTGTEVREVTEGSTKFKITSKAQPVASSTEQFTCGTSSTADYLQTTSSVTWAALGKHAPVTQSSIVSAPTSGGLLVEVIDQNSKGLEGATVNATGATAQTTPASGCVIFGALTSGTVTVTAEDGGDVDPSGDRPASKEVTLGGTSLTPVKLQLAAWGSITASFENKGTAVTGDTFYAQNSEVPAPSGFVGGTASKFVSSASLGELYPFTSAAYTVFAGDCEANNPEVLSKKEVTDRTGLVTPSGTASVKVEEPEVPITVYKGTKSVPGAVLTTPSSAKIIDAGCKSKSAQNASPIEYKHAVTLDSTGKLAQKYQPYAAELEFCVVMLESSTYYKYLSPKPFSSITKAGAAAQTIYLKETATGTNGYSKSTAKLEC
jgi:Tfp pilus assembly protein PilV